MSVIANSSLLESSPSSGQNTALLRLKERMSVFVQDLERARAEVNQKNAKIEEEILKNNAVYYFLNQCYLIFYSTITFLLCIG